MREIKFRVWTGTQMLDSGFSVNPHGAVYDIHRNEQTNWTPLQYTGLKDINGVEIYEGDRLHQLDPLIWNPFTVGVTDGFWTAGGSLSAYVIEKQELIIIGNMFHVEHSNENQ